MKIKLDNGIEKIQKIVANFYGIKIADLSSQNRARAIARPRQIAMFLLREETKSSFPEIGSKLGGRDHSTILYGSEKIAKETANNETTKSTIDILIKKLNPS